MPFLVYRPGRGRGNFLKKSWLRKEGKCTESMQIYDVVTVDTCMYMYVVGIIAVAWPRWRQLLILASILCICSTKLVPLAPPLGHFVTYSRLVLFDLLLSMQCALF